jgi:hypothetical protein
MNIKRLALPIWQSGQGVASVILAVCFSCCRTDEPDGARLLKGRVLTPRREEAILLDAKHFYRKRR